MSTVLSEQTLLQGKIPFDILLDAHLKDLSRYRVLVLANQDALSDEAVKLIRTFVQNGGGLVATEDTSLLTDWRLRRPKFALADVFGVETPPQPDAPAARKPAGFPGAAADAGGPAPNPAVQHTFGAGRSVYLARIEPSIPPPAPQINYTFSSQYWGLPRNYKNLLSAVSWASNDRLAADIQAPPSVGIELIGREGANTYLLHLVNFDFKHPVRDIAVRLRIPAGMNVQQAFVESPDFDARETLAAAVRDGVASFRVPRLQIYNLVQVKMERR